MLRSCKQNAVDKHLHGGYYCSVLYLKGCDEEGPAVDVHREPGMLRSRQQKLPSDYRFRADVPNEV